MYDIVISYRMTSTKRHPLGSNIVTEPIFSKDAPPKAIFQKSNSITIPITDTICLENNSKRSIAPKQQITRKKNNGVKFNSNTHFSFNKKLDALNHINEKIDSVLKLFSEDLSTTNGSKKFIVSTYDNIYCLSKNKERNFYENYESDQQVKLILDIDYKTKNKTISVDAFDDLLKRCVVTVNNKIKEYTDITPIIIILKSCREEKMSAHIIYNNIHFASVLQMKCFMMLISSPLIADKIIDPNIYKVSCMRLLWNSKLGKSNVMDYDKNDCQFLRNNKYQYTTDYKLFMDCLITNVSNDSHLIEIDIDDTLPKSQIASKKNTKLNTPILNVDKTVNNIDIAIIKQYVDILKPERADDYNSWLNIGMCIYNSNSTKEGLSLWNEWSMKSDSYDGQNILMWKWRSFETHRKKVLSIKTLKYYAKKDNPELYSAINHINNMCEDVQKYNAITINENYLLNRVDGIYERIKDRKTIVTQSVWKWLKTSIIKTFAFKSPYNTGKTSLVSQILDEFDPQKVLFITHRQSLTNELYGTFGNHGFCSYLNQAFDAQRLICQIESLHKITLNSDPFYYESTRIINSYDLVILDEIESLLYHYESPTIELKQQTFNLMSDIIRKSKKVLALDGDFGNRAYDFISDFGNSIILHNTIKKDPKHISFSNDLIKFDKSINDQLLDNKKIVIVTMSADIATKYYEKYKSSYKVLMHCGKSDDQLKELLKNVEGNWIKYDMIIYSPSVQSGVSFDIPHFDKMFVVLSSKSCSARDLNQMCHRVRQFMNNNIDVYLNGLPFREKVVFHTYDEAAEYVKLIYSKYSIGYDNLENYETSLYTKILIHNELENLNKSPYYFVPMFIKLINEKGNTYSFDDSKKSRCKKGEAVMNFNKESVMNADDIDKYSFNEYMKCQMNNTATSEMKYAIEKYLYKKNWKVDEVNTEFLDKWFRKTYVLYNLRQLKKGDIEDDLLTIDVHTDKRYLNYEKAKQKQRIEYVKDLVETMGFSFDNIGKESMISRDVFDVNREKCMKECKIFTDRVKSESLFDLKINKMQTNRAFMGFVNTLLQHYGVCIKSCKKNSRDPETKKVIKKFSYYIDYCNDINNYL
jgi:hypothetical protein